MTFFRRLFYNLFYFRKPPWDTGISPPELLEFIRSHPPGRALDLGCGTATNVITLAQHGWQVTGVDFAWRAIAIGQRKLLQAGVQADLRVEDVTRLDQVHGPFDLTLDMGCFHNLSDAGQAAYLNNLERLLAPGGFFLLYVFFRPEANSPRPGVVEADLSAIATRFKLVQRQDGTERGRVPAAWLTFQK